MMGQNILYLVIPCYNEQEVRKRKGLFERWDEQ